MEFPAVCQDCYWLPSDSSYGTLVELHKQEPMIKHGLHFKQRRNTIQGFGALWASTKVDLMDLLNQTCNHLAALHLRKGAK